MDTGQASTSSFPLVRTLLTMTAWAAVMAAVELWLVATLFPAAPGAKQAVLMMATVVWASGLLSVMPVWRAGGMGPLVIVRAFFKGSGLRILICLAAMVVAIKGYALPPGPVVVALMGTYLPVLFAETAIVVRYVKTRDAVPVRPVRPGTEALS